MEKTDAPPLRQADGGEMDVSVSHSRLQVNPRVWGCVAAPLQRLARMSICNSALKSK